MQSRPLPALARLDEPIVRIIATLTNVAWVVVGGLALFADNVALAVSVWPAVTIAFFAMAQLISGRHNVLAVLVVAATSIAVGALVTPTAASQAPTAIALAAVGTVLSLYVGTRLVLFVATYSLGLMAVMSFGGPDLARGFVAGLVGATVFGFTTYLIRWLLFQAALETERYRNLFRHSPIAMWEEDFSGVELLLNELRARGDDLAAYLHRHPDAALRIAGLVEVRAANDAAVRLLEAESEADLLGEVRNRDIDALDSLTRQLLAVWNGDNHVLTEIENAKTLRGNKVHLALSWAAPYINGKLDLAHVSVAAVDITESREARAALEGLVRSKDELVATVSHELRTPLTTVVGLADVLSTSIDDFAMPELRELISLIASEGREVTTIVEDLLIAAQAETGSLHLQRERFDLVRLAGDVHRTWPESDQVALFVPDRSVWVEADPIRTRQIVRNLVVNAGRYGGPSVRLCVAASPTIAAVEVRDDGPPLPFKEREAIFDRYYRARQVPGLTASVGLGLTVSRTLARDMGGDLIYAHDGSEAIFELTLPLAVAEPAGNPEPESPGLPSARTRQEAAG